MNNGYKRTLCASFIGSATLSISNNLAPLLFVLFQQEFEISVAKIGLLITYNFCIQTLVDLIAARYAEKVGYKKCIVAAEIFCAVGVSGLGVFPFLLPDPYVGLLLAVGAYAIGGGLLEVLVSPIVEALPLSKKSGAMSLLHSFYCWGHALVVILTTLFFHFAGTQSWRIVTFLWALIPAANAVLFATSPIITLAGDAEQVPIRNLFKVRVFWVFLFIMLCAGAAELSMAQWASYFAERGLGVSKAFGDLLGPCMFALLMGTARALYAAFSSKIRLNTVLIGSGALCVLSYLVAVFSPHPVLSLIGCGLCGLSVGIMWPGTLSLSAERFPQCGAAMFGLLALAGDVGCSAGPSVVGFVSQLTDGRLQSGLLVTTIFPVFLIISVSMLRKYTK